MADSLSSAAPLDGVCGIIECGDAACIVCHTLLCVTPDADGNVQDYNGIGVIRVDSRWTGPAHTESVLHEWLHQKHPHWSEDAVEKEASQICALMHLPEVKRRSFS